MMGIKSRPKRGSRGFAMRAWKIEFLTGGTRDIIWVRNFPNPWSAQMRKLAICLAGVAAGLMAAPAVAHHAFAMFDQSKLVYMTGTVKEFELVNPHGWLHVTMPTDKGDTATWAFEGGSVNQLNVAWLEG